MRIGPQPHSDEWYALHRNIITATDISAILGQNEYKTALDVFLEKTGRVPPFEGNEHTRRGTRYEPVILADYAETKGVALNYPMPFVYHPKLDVLGCSPDAQRKEDGNLVEAKMTMSRTRAVQLGEEGSDELPTDWLLQGQTQMLCCDVEEVDFAVLLFGKLKIYKARRQPKLGAIIEDAAADMMHRIKTDDAPEPTWENPRTADLIKGLYNIESGKTILLPDTCLAFWESYKKLGEAASEIKKKREEMQARILHEMKDAEIGILSDPTFELVHATVNRKGYTVAETTYKQLKAVKCGKKK